MTKMSRNEGECAAERVMRIEKMIVDDFNGNGMEKK
jgi:hypothetical protein